jgi:uncharacterized glyoxalase superfamily protein PhnB
MTTTTFTDVITVLAYTDIAAAHDYLVDRLAFASGGLYRDGDGHVVHGEVTAGCRRIWLHLTSEEHRLSSPAAIGTACGGTVVLVDDVDAHFEAARRAGATITREPSDQDYGQREYEVEDPEGHRWWIATPIAVGA